jgi:hypothetical protein
MKIWLILDFLDFIQYKIQYSCKKLKQILKYKEEQIIEAYVCIEDQFGDM